MGTFHYLNFKPREHLLGLKIKFFLYLYFVDYVDPAYFQVLGKIKNSDYGVRAFNL